jgi:hypothetical protein
MTGWYVLGVVTGVVATALILEPAGLLQSPAFVGAIVGGLLAIAGGWFAQSHVLRNTMKIKMDEAVAARKVAANAEAYRNIKRVEGAFIQQSRKDAYRLILDREQWLFDNRFFLPGEFPNHWLTARTNLGLLAMGAPSRPIEDAEKLEQNVNAALAGAIAEIYKDSGMEQPDWDRFSDRNTDRH